MTMVLLVDIGRWGVIFPLDYQLDDFFGWNKHLVNFVPFLPPRPQSNPLIDFQFFLLVEFVVNRIPFHAIDVFWPILWSCLYIAFAWIYHETEDLCAS